jgi:hypothetical protein
MIWTIINHKTDDYHPLWIDPIVAKTLALVLRSGFIETTFLGFVLGFAGLIFHQSLATEGDTTAS